MKGADGANRMDQESWGRTSQRAGRQHPAEEPAWRGPGKGRPTSVIKDTAKHGSGSHS